MDAAEHDADLKLYKASPELLAEVQAKLPALVTNPQHSGRRIRRWIISSKVDDITKLLDRFQEWPQLLDPHLAINVQILANAFLSYCSSFSEEYERPQELDSQIIPLPRAVARVLYTLCKVRGQKVIVRLLNNEPKYVEPLLSCFRRWGFQSRAEDRLHAGQMGWEERYIMLLWLSHLMLAPFQLSSISGLAIDSEIVQRADITANLPDVAENLLDLALGHLQVPSKAREAASTLVVRMTLRGDMQALGLPAKIINWALKELKTRDSGTHATEYHYIGLLSLLFGMANSSSDSESVPFINDLLVTIHALADIENGQYEHIRDQAPARKLIVKIIRAAMIHALSISASHTTSMDTDSLLESSIQLLLEYLADKDTPVRQAASKALGYICVRLDADMSGEVIEAVLGCLDEKVFLEDLSTAQLVSITDVLAADAGRYRKNISAVDPLKWHGAMLTLGHFLFRRSPPPEQLPSIIEALLIGLEFEQRSNVGTSVGVGVRDAACFGIWSLARKYSTSELNSIQVTKSMLPHGCDLPHSQAINVIQIVAVRLVSSACLDPSGNIRRGSSAALQELIGRHPDCVAQGIRVVQVVDYHAVARRSRAIEEVAMEVSKLDDTYQSALQYALLQWRGARATDAESKRVAAEAVGMLYSTMPPAAMRAYLQDLLLQITRLRPSNNGSNAAARHGLVLALATILEVVARTPDLVELQTIASLIEPLTRNIAALTGTISGRVTNDIENVFEAIANFVKAYVNLLLRIRNHHVDHSTIQTFLEVLDRCTTSSDKDLVTTAAARANVAMLSLIPHYNHFIRERLNSKTQKKADYACRGRITTLAAIFPALDKSKSDENWQLKDLIVAYFCSLIDESHYSIEIKVNAMHAIQVIISSSADLSTLHLSSLASAITTGLSNYTVDQRGDIGSQLRLASIDTAQVLCTKGIEDKAMVTIFQLVVKLAGERLAKVRFQAWTCLQSSLPNFESHESFSIREDISTQKLHLQAFQHQADVSSFEYYKALLQFLRIPGLRDHLLLGIISSAAAGTEDISRASTAALVADILENNDRERQQFFTSTLDFIVNHLDEIANQDDRDVVPAVDFFVFLLEEVLLLVGSDVSNIIDVAKIWRIIQRVHIPASTIARLEGLVRLYSAMLNVNTLRTPALERMTRMLLHKWPKIRSAAAAAIYFDSSNDSILLTDWHAPAVSNKQTVVELRKNLHVAGVPSGLEVRMTAAAQG